jgi:hypothetical protein
MHCGRKKLHSFYGKYSFESASLKKKQTESDLCLGAMSKGLVRIEGVLHRAIAEASSMPPC